MSKVTKEDIEKARNLIATGNQKALGYRVLVKVIESTTEMEIAEKKKFAALAEAGFETKSKDQADRESRGAQYGIVASVGSGVFAAQGLGDDKIQEGDVVSFDRYAGVEKEIPPGSGDIYRLMNDESLLIKVET